MILIFKKGAIYPSKQRFDEISRKIRFVQTSSLVINCGPNSSSSSWFETVVTVLPASLCAILALKRKVYSQKLFAFTFSNLRFVNDVVCLSFHSQRKIPPQLNFLFDFDSWQCAYSAIPLNKERLRSEGLQMDLIHFSNSLIEWVLKQIQLK